MFSDAQADDKSTNLQKVGERTKRNKEKRSSPTPCSRVLLDKPVVAWLIKELHILYETWQFINYVHDSLPQEPIQIQISPDLICKPYSLNIQLNIILPAMTRTYNSLSFSGFLTKILQAFLSLPCGLHVPCISSLLLWSLTNTFQGEQITYIKLIL